jgi:hypothetical protein
MILTLIGKIKSAEILYLRDQNNNPKNIIILEIVDVYDGCIQKINYLTTSHDEIEKNIGKYISIPYVLQSIDDNTVILAISEQFPYKITDNDPLVILHK